jgi:hypothetical protein
VKNIERVEKIIIPKERKSISNLRTFLSKQVSIPTSVYCPVEEEIIISSVNKFGISGGLDIESDSILFPTGGSYYKGYPSLDMIPSRGMSSRKKVLPQIKKN